MSEAQVPTTSNGTDLYSKTLALLRRLFVGNGYKLEEVQITQLENTDYHLPGKLLLELEVNQQMQHLLGPARGGEARIFRDRTEQESYLSSIRENLGQENWIDDVRALIEKSPGGGWAMEEGFWPLPRLSQRVALQQICDICLGKRVERCDFCHGTRELMCQQCNGAGLMNCPACFGSGADQADRSRPCPRCMGRRQIPCQHCQGRQRVQCHNCRGTGEIQCRTCQGHGFQTEENTITCRARGRFVLGDLGAAPNGLSLIVEHLGPEGLARGHALVTPDNRANAAGENAVHYVATIPYGKYTFKLGEQTHTIEAVGMKPILAEFPSLLDDILQPVMADLNAITLTGYTRKYRIIRELSEALAKGQRPGQFFGQRYPFGLSAPFAFELAAKLKQVFTGVSLVPRIIAGSIGTLSSIGAYYVWLTYPRLDLLPPQIPSYILDLGVAFALALLVWLAVGLMGKQALRRLMPTPTSLRAASGLIGWLFASAVLLGCAGLLYWPYTRPEWVSLFIR